MFNLEDKMNKYFYYSIPIIALILLVPWMLMKGTISPVTIIKMISGTFTGKIGSADLLLFIPLTILPFVSLFSLFVPSLIKDERWKNGTMIFFTIVNIIVLISILFAYFISFTMKF